MIGTRVPKPDHPISREHLQDLTASAVWGRGALRGVGYTKDGRTLGAASYYGISLYDLDRLSTPPDWIPFERPIQYHSLAFSENENFLLLESFQGQQAVQLSDGKLLDKPPQVTWVKTTAYTPQWSDQVVQSQAEPFVFQSTLEADPENITLMTSIREIHHQETGELLYALPDQTIQLTYEERAEPLGCDLFTFGYCGNAFKPLALLPTRVGFSPAGGLLAVLYQPAELGYTAHRYSLLRLYNTGDGRLITTLGSYQRPVETYAYSPDGSQILIGYGDGTVEVLSLPNLEQLFSARHFQTPIQRLEFSPGGPYLVIQRREEVEVRRLKDGLLLNRQAATAFALSPLDNHLALGTETGELQLWDLNSNQLLYSRQAHSAEVYALAFSPGGDRLTSSGEDCTVRSWYANSGTLSHFYEENTTNAYGEETTESRIFVYHLKYLEGTDHLLGFGSWSRIVNWDVQTGDTRYMIEPDALEYYRGMMTLDPHFPGAVMVNEQQEMMTIGGLHFDLQTGKLLGEEEKHRTGVRDCHQSGLSLGDGSVRVSPGLEERSGQLCFLDAESGKLLQALEIIPEKSADHFWISKLDLSPDGRQLFITLNEGLLLVVQVTG